jgi:4-amino-4-deoxy-L-arabinose transferase-like glycosyltransferase
MLDAHRSPARVSAAAAAELPRWALWLLLAGYGLAGLFGRDPWFQDDAASFGVMWTMARGDAADWLLPNVLGASVAEEGPLAFWVGAVFIRLLGPWLGDALAARLTCTFWLLLATVALWYGAYRLARRDEAQPVAFVFGGEANARDYGRMLADIAVLLFLGTVGIVVRLHETTAETAAVALVCVVVYAMASALDGVRAGAWVTGIALGALALARGAVPALFVLAAVLAAAPSAPDPRARRAILLVAPGVAATLLVAWPLAAVTLFPDQAVDYFRTWRAWNLESVGLPGAAELARIARNFPWYTWPLWPLALWAVYCWRHALRAPHMAIAGLLSVATLARLLFADAPSEAMLILTVPPLVLLAAFGATALRRAAENALDWFAIAAFSLLAIGGWAYFTAMQTGTPPKMAASIARLVPGFVVQAHPAPIAIALAATLGWLALVVWRVRARPPMLWRGPVLAASGLTMFWVVANALFLPAANYNRTYDQLARQVAAQVRALPASDCVFAHRLLPAHRALFALHGGLRFVAPEQQARCTVALHRDSRRSRLDDEPPPGAWAPVWEGSWPARQDEVFRLYRRVRE